MHTKMHHKPSKKNSLNGERNYKYAEIEQQKNNAQKSKYLQQRRDEKKMKKHSNKSTISYIQID